MKIVALMRSVNLLSHVMGLVLTILMFIPSSPMHCKLSSCVGKEAWEEPNVKALFHAEAQTEQTPMDACKPSLNLSKCDKPTLSPDVHDKPALNR